MTESDASPAATLAADLAAQFGSDGWLSFHVGDDPPAARWMTRDQLVDDDAAGLTEIVEMRHRLRPDVARKLLWADLVGAIAHPAISPITQLLSTCHRRPILDARTLALGVVGNDKYVALRGVWYRQPQMQVLEGDPLSGMPGVDTVRSIDAMLADFVEEAETFFEPVIEAVRRRAPVGRRGLWGMAVDSLLWPFANQADDEPAEEPVGRVERVSLATAGTPLAHQAGWVHFEHADRPRAQILTTSCCLAYKWPVLEGAEGRRDSCDPRWDRYCMSCPLIPADETAHRARYWIDHPGGD